MNDIVAKSWSQPIGRRRFLKLAAAALAATGCGAEAGAGKSRKVAVIGAGMAGLTAARTLVEAGCEVVVFEARDRIGGRIWTDRSWKGVSLDLGAQWIQGRKDNPVVQLVQKAGAKTLAWDEDVQQLWDAGGQRVSEQETEELDQLFERLLEELDELEAPEGSAWSLRQAIEKVVSRWKLTARQRQGLEYEIHSTVALEYAASAEELAFPFDEKEEEAEGGDSIFPDGYASILPPHAEGLDIRLNQPVRSIELLGRGKARVVTASGDWTGDAVVVTLPLGVLKTDAVRFTPRLPERKLQAIQRLGMGVLDKLYLRFPRIFWPNEYNHFRQIPAQAGRWSEWMNISRYASSPILMAFHASPYARELEKLPEPEVIAQAMAALRGLFGSAIPEPEAAIRTAWAKDPYTWGSYSIEAVGSSAEDRVALGEPVEQTLFFAGEATHVAFPALVHGAYWSGELAARQVLAL